MIEKADEALKNKIKKIQEMTGKRTACRRWDGKGRVCEFKIVAAAARSESLELLAIKPELWESNAFYKTDRRIDFFTERCNALQLR